MAIIDMRHFLFEALKDSRGVHVETLLTVAGALAGFSAQYAIRETIVKTGKLPEHGVGTDFNGGAFVEIRTDDGSVYYFGDILNSYLVPTPLNNPDFGPGNHCLFNIVGGAVVAAGGRILSQADYSEIFRRTASTIGTPQFGIPMLPNNHSAAMSPVQALKASWPTAKTILTRSDPRFFDGVALKSQYCPVVLAVVINGLVQQAKATLDPSLAMRIVFEAAIPMSKINPLLVDA